MKKISDQLSEKESTKPKNAHERIEETKAFYEGDIIKMDKYQTEAKEVDREIKWYEWDFAFVISNPDFGADKGANSGMYISSLSEAIGRYKKCFKTIYRESQVEMKKERKLEIELVESICNNYFVKDNGKIQNKYGGRFKKSEIAVDRKSISSEVELEEEGGDEDDEVPEEGNDQRDVRVFEGDVHLDEEDYDPYVDTKLYCADFSTMILNAMIYRLNRVLGFETCLIMSKTGKYLYLLIKGNPGELRMHAQNQEYSLSLEVGYCDLVSQSAFSLEPCDSLCNPLDRVDPPEELKEKINKNIHNIRNHLHEIYDLGKEDNDTDPNDVFVENINSMDFFVNNSIAKDVWENYIKFLEILDQILAEGIRKLDLKGKYAGVFVSLCYIAAKEYINKNTSRSGKLFNLWDRLGTDSPIPAPTKYVRKINSKKKDELDRFWVRHLINENRELSIFSNADKLKIMDRAIQETFLIYNLKHYNFIKGYFPLHNEFELSGMIRMKNITEDTLSKQFKNVMGEELYECVYKETKSVIPEWKINPLKIFDPPVKNIRDYFGEKIAYYFDYLSYYTKFVALLIPIGLTLFIIFNATSETSTVLRVFYVIYGVLNIIMSTLLIEYMKRREKILATRFGQTEFIEQETIRPLFEGVFRRSPIDDDMNDPWFYRFSRYFRILWSCILLSLCVALELGITAALFYGRYKLADNWKGESKILGAAYIFAVLKAFSIILFDILFTPVCFFLTKLENQRTKQSFEYSYVLKMYIFRACNHFSSLVYIAFAKDSNEGCFSTDYYTQGNANCMWELKWELIFIMIFLILQNVYEISVPLIRTRGEGSKKINEETIIRKTDEAILKSKIRIEFHKPSYEDGEINGIVDEYMELMLQFGYVSFFSLGFSLIPIIVFINNIFEMIVDRSKILYMTRRPIQESVKNNGMFTKLVEITSFFSVFSNIAILCFTSNAFGNADKFIGFLWLNVSIFILRFFLQELIPDEPDVAFIIKNRHKNVVERTLGLHKGDGEKIKSEKTDFSIYNTLTEEEGKKLREEIKEKEKRKDEEAKAFMNKVKP